jgi:hypothetical protein
MTLVLSVNITGAARVFIVGERSFIWIIKSKGPKSDPVGFHALLFPSLSMYFGFYKGFLCMSLFSIR